ncbi:MAG: hypothetical protein CND84_02350 [Marine Group II euryarchaeote MED-G35]|nr:MAG: hypothetical protein CND84_02350 [Marine Group II euryarchaeote MED-G35]
MQRRRRKKAAPKNIFGSVPQTTQKSKPTNSSKPKTSRVRSQIAPPPSVPGAKPKAETTITPEKPPLEATTETADNTPAVAKSSVVEKPLIEEPQSVETKQVVDNLQDQILEDNSSKDIGLENKLVQPAEKTPDEDKQGKSLKARQIIQNSMIKASLAVEQAKTLKKTQVKPITTKEPPKKPQRKFRNKTSSYQPANRARRLDRSRHMEYKYEMRGLLLEIGIDEEHRSNLLATIWARGERQTTKEAKEFLVEKLNEGIIDDDQMSSLEKIVDGYTVRR